MSDPRVRAITDLANELGVIANKCTNPTYLGSALLMLMNNLAENAKEHAPQSYKAAMARSLRQCADHWEYGKTPNYTHTEEEAN